jgi:hypothetical protein
LRHRVVLWCSCFTVFPTSLIAGARWCRAWPQRVTMRSSPIVVGLAAPPAGTIPGTQIPFHFSRSYAASRAQYAARPDRTCLRAWLSQDRDDGGTRPGLAHGWLGSTDRPDMFPRLTLIGGGFGGPPSFPSYTANGAPTPQPEFTNDQLDAEYAKLNPPRKDYQDYWRSRQADRT